MDNPLQPPQKMPCRIVRPKIQLSPPKVRHDGRHKRMGGESPRLGELLGQGFTCCHDIREHVRHCLFTISKFRHRGTTKEAAGFICASAIILRERLPHANICEKRVIPPTRRRIHAVLRSDVRPADGEFRLELRRAPPEEMCNLHPIAECAMLELHAGWRVLDDLVIPFAETGMRPADKVAADDDLLSSIQRRCTQERHGERECSCRDALIRCRNAAPPWKCTHIFHWQGFEQAPNRCLLRRNQEFISIEWQDDVSSIIVSRFPQKPRHCLRLHITCRRHILNDNWQPFCLQCFKNLSCSIRTFVVSDNQQIGKTKRVAHKALDNIHFVLYHRDRDDFFHQNSIPFCALMPF